MIDLHSHTDRSDGVFSPERLVELASNNGLNTLGITDHDTVAGYDDAVPHAPRYGVELVCGVELGAKFHDKTIHVLGYFLEGPADAEFRRHLDCLAKSRRDRNERLAKRLRELGVDITLEEVARRGRGQTGRPHFAGVLVEKGYVGSYREAFEVYLDEKAKGFVPRGEPTLENVIRWIRASRGIPVWAHPARFIRAAKRPPEQIFKELADRGMLAIECYHRDHRHDECDAFAKAARKLGLGVTGGSDFHGPTPDGTPLGGLELPDSLLEEFREFAARNV